MLFDLSNTLFYCMYSLMFRFFLSVSFINSVFVCVCVLACMYVEGIYVFYQLFIWVDNGWFSMLPGGEFT